MRRSEEIYEVFAARAERMEPLRNVGAVRATNSREAAVFAHTLYDEWRWREMFVVPRTALMRVIRPA
ncbi:MAG: hypothetical protein ACT4PY_14605 [Armatimonadota bacterium]